MKLPLAVCLTVLIAATCGAATADAAAFRCSASAGRITVLGQTTEPLTANASGTACAGDNKSVTGPAAGFTGPLTIGALLASTEVFPAQKSVVSTGGVADLRVASAPSLPITLPPVAVPDAAKALIAGALHTSVDLSAVKSLIPVLDTNLVTNLITTLPTNLITTLPTTLPVDLPVDLPTNLITTLPTNLPTNLVLDPANPLLNDPLEVIAANAANAATNAANLATNAANLATNAANAATNGNNAVTNAANAALNAANLATNASNAATNATNLAQNVLNATLNAANDATNVANAAINLVRGAIPASVNVDVSGALDSALAALLPDGKLPARDLLRVQGAVAYAA
ncbi:MAG: hypothetical protein JWM73_1375, partial [Solirubrobacterales bacterium]|nr:hypothetical protein [Solirubrobacterales bacterium]